MIYGTIPADQMPHPCCLVDYGEHGVMAAMFHFESGPDVALDDIAAENGYDIQFLELPEGHPLWGDEHVLAKWRPDPPEGWIFGGVSMTDDGPVALFLKAFADAQDDEEDEARPDTEEAAE